MPVPPMVDLIQHGRRLLISSMSFDMGNIPNAWYRLTTTDAPDAEIVEAVMTAFDHSKSESWLDLPQPTSADSTLESERLGFPTSSSMESCTTFVGLALIDGAVDATPYITILGRGYSGRDGLQPARGQEEIAQRIREALAESARLSAKVVDHDAIARAQVTDGADVPDVEPEDPRVRAQVATVRDFAQVMLTRHDGRWAVEAVSTMPGRPPMLLPNGWVRAVEATDRAGLTAAIVEGLTRSETTPALPPDEWVPLLCDALDATPEQLTAPGAARLSVEAYPGRGDISIWPQEIDEDWWEDPENPERRGVDIDDPFVLWIRTIDALADEMVETTPGT